jgi:hypothetical protein
VHNILIVFDEAEYVIVGFTAGVDEENWNTFKFVVETDVPRFVFPDVSLVGVPLPPF